MWKPTAHHKSPVAGSVRQRKKPMQPPPPGPFSLLRDWSRESRRTCTTKAPPWARNSFLARAPTASSAHQEIFKECGDQEKCGVICAEFQMRAPCRASDPNANTPANRNTTIKYAQRHNSHKRADPEVSPEGAARRQSEVNRMDVARCEPWQKPGKIAANIMLASTVIRHSRTPDATGARPAASLPPGRRQTPAPA